MNPAILITGLVLGAVISSLVIWLLISVDRADLTVSPEWRRSQAASEVRAVGVVEHEYVVGGKVVLRHPDEETVRSVKAAVEQLRGGDRG